MEWSFNHWTTREGPTTSITFEGMYTFTLNKHQEYKNRSDKEDFFIEVSEKSFSVMFSFPLPTERDVTKSKEADFKIYCFNILV